MGKHHHHRGRQDNNNNFLSGLGEFLSGMNISQLASIVQALNLKSVDTSQLTSLISRLGIGNLSGNQIGAALNNNKSAAEGPITLNSLANMGLINKNELSSLLSRYTDNSNKEKTPEEEQAQKEGMNEVMGTLQSLLSSIDTNQLMGIISKLNLNNDNK